MFSEIGLLRAIPAAIYVTDAEGRITFYNEAAAELWGHGRSSAAPDGAVRGACTSRTAGRCAHDECPMAMTLREGASPPGQEAIVERPDGTRVPSGPFRRRWRTTRAG